MLNSVDFSGRPFHFIGIGGIGMSALAYVLTKRKLPVSGSDLSLNHITQRLQEQGAHIFWSQVADNLKAFCSASVSSGTEMPSGSIQPVPTDCFLPQVICSTAIHPANPEYRAALEMGCPIFHRSELLAALMQQQRGIAVAGTHGKTTTSSMIGYLLLKAGLDPTIIVGGEVNAWEGNAVVGQGEYLVAEADESDGSLVRLAAEIGVVTNIELDHPDHYATLDEVIDTFQTFARQCKTLIGCVDCPTVQEALQPTITYSLEPSADADYTVDRVVYNAMGISARVWERGVLLGQLELRLLGRHNLSNSLAAIAVGRKLGLGFEQIAEILATFEGARRRFEHRGEHNQILFIDDYAHHPSEIQVTLAAARLRAQMTTPPRRVVAVFQPHRYSRTQTFLAEFGQAFSDADLVVITDIYSAGEPNVDNMTGQQVADTIATHHAQVIYQPTLQSTAAFLIETLLAGDLAIFLGAGNLNRIIPELTAYYQKVDESRVEACVSPA
ncbi:UDP-N-acetylmuramate--L-alanine ligase [Leptolyngbya sp. FACHB-711]|uniref:UDP-N-acetylmuramate--L-alanine ligase n=1 Tax=unclassified Leptolyngbya TaxID=2650499 RepID=UPI001689476D|nr:UDP-N-acetylmuramate--L-alanine ligase [Leptolyngbya sp. FACHB-711]MBD1848645.1 UDP-N-acetylmuramate--L-alanine ligase [Cyanobacteria bacterium FACHB-502]MBD2027415.1 UDP-N-acetylmuramate--L-alanine ligase [Leptolyngbya sp. FACHB-711]